MLGSRLPAAAPLSRVVLLALFCTLAAAALPSLAQSQAVPAGARVDYPDASSYPVPADLGSVHFYLVTVDVGDRVWDNFGHSALRVIDEANGVDVVFNWGYFDASGGVVSFAWNFFKGIMNYALVTNTPAFEFAQYRGQQRSVWQDRINLTNPQKAILYKRLMWNLEPANTVYPYHYFFDNCTTRIRDYLDEALGGRISRHYTGTTDTSFRDQVSSHYASIALIDVSLDILMNSNIDRPMTEWENMFLPLDLRRRLHQLTSDVAEQGKVLPLLSASQNIMTFDPPSKQSNGYKAASVVLLAPVLFLFALLKKIPQSYFATHSRIGLKATGLSFRLLGLLAVLTGLFSGVYGSLMLGSWFVSDHLDLHHNMNLLLFWPTDLIGVLIGLRWLLACKPWPIDHNTAPFVNNYLLAHVVAMLIYGGCALFDVSAQNLEGPALFILPGMLLYTLLIWLVGFVPARPKHMFF